MASLFLVCGPDCSGKTTLVQELKSQLHDKVAVLHMVYRHRQGIFIYHTAALHYAERLLAKGTSVILDRHWPSELIYARVFRGGSPWPHEGRLMDRVLQKYAALHIFCGGSVDTIVARHARLKQERHELYNHNIQTVAREYYDLYHGAVNAAPRDYAEAVAALGGFCRRNDAIDYSIEQDGVNLVEFCDMAIHKQKCWAQLQYPLALLSAEPNVLGHLNQAEFLFVGDRCNPKYHQLQWPFYDYGHCSLFLAEILHEIGFNETRGMWTNINGPGSEHVSPLLTRKNLKVLALGVEAAAGLKKLGVPFVKLAHPQHAKRFGSPAEYASELAYALRIQ